MVLRSDADERVCFAKNGCSKGGERVYDLSKVTACRIAAKYRSALVSQEHKSAV